MSHTILRIQKKKPTTGVPTNYNVKKASNNNKLLKLVTVGQPLDKVSKIFIVLRF